MFGTNATGTNMTSTNVVSSTNRAGLGPQDVAATEFDRNLIIRFRGTLMQRLGGTPAAWTPVTLNSANGVVTAGGVVSSMVIKQRLVATLQTFPGVVRVIDQVNVDTNLGVNTGASATTAGVGLGVNGAATATPPPPMATNPTVLSPTGRPAPIPVPRGGLTTLTNTPPVTTP